MSCVQWAPCAAFWALQHPGKSGHVWPVQRHGEDGLMQWEAWAYGRISPGREVVPGFGT